MPTMKKTIVVMVVLFMLSGLLVSACGKTETRPTFEYLEEWQVGGYVNTDYNYQLFARIAVVNNKTEELFTSEIQGLPEGIKVVRKEIKTLRRHYHNYFIDPTDSQTGVYPFTIVMSSTNKNHEINGEVEVLKTVETSDTLMGGHSRSRVLPDIDLSSMSNIHSAPIKNGVLTGPVSNGSQIFVATKDGYLISFDDELTQLWKTHISETALDTLQIHGKHLITSTIDGTIEVHEISNLSENKIKPASSLKLKSRLSGLPTILSAERMVVGTNDGRVILLSYPKLKTVWTFQTKGAIIGSIPATVGYNKSGELKGTLFVASNDRYAYYLNLDGEQIGQEGPESELITNLAVWEDRVVFTTDKNTLKLRNRYGMIDLDMGTEHHMEFAPSFNGDYIVTARHDRIHTHSAGDGFLQLDMKPEKEIVDSPIIMDNKIILPLIDNTMRILNITDGTELGKLNFQGKLLGWPQILENNNFVMMNTDGNITMWGERKKSELVGKVNLQSVKYHGGRGDNRHTGSLKISLPENPTINLRISGVFAPALISEKYLYLYEMIEEEFSCRSRSDGGIIWNLKEKSFPGGFFGAGMDAGPHESPVYLTEEGLYLATISGLWLVDPNTGEILRKTQFMGIPQIDDDVIVLSSQQDGLTCLNRSMELLWNIPTVIVSSGSVCIDRNEVIMFDRNEDASKILILDKLSGKIIFEEEDAMLQFATKLAVSDKHAITGTLAGTWIMTRNPNAVYGVLNGTNHALNPLIVDGVIASMFEGIGTISKLIAPSGYRDQPIFELLPGNDSELSIIFFSGNEFLTSKMIVTIAEKIEPEIEDKPLTSSDLDNQKPEVYLTFRDRATGSMISEVFIDDTGCTMYTMTACDGVVAISKQGSLPELMLIGE